MLKKTLFFVLCISSLITTAQITVKGTVYDEYLEPFPGATIKVPSGTTISDYDGNFTIRVAKLPVNVTVSSSGYSDETSQAIDATTEINIILKEALALNQVVISASRTPERVMESPVTIERLDSKIIKNTASPNFYEGLKNLKGIDVLDNNYLTKTVVSNRGFASTDNVRFVQLVDGVDTSVPAFDFSLGNLFGLNELDVKNIEILPGAASALYGANALNGILLMTSKNPFDHEGLSAYAKTGFTSEEERGSKSFIDVGFRYAHKFSDRIAAKINVSYQSSEDWLANDLSNINGDGFDHSNANTNYNGVNVYGDEISLNLVDLAIIASGDAFTNNPDSPLNGLDPLNLISSIADAEDVRISRTGFRENAIVDSGVNNLLFDFSLHFRPWENNTEIILATKHSKGDNVSQLGNRYFQKNSSLQHYRFEIKNDNYFVRAYYSENDAGDTYDSKLAGVFSTVASKSNSDFFQEYAAVYFTALNSGATTNDAHNAARAFVNSSIPADDSDVLNNLVALAKSTNIADGGAKLSENSGFYNIDANWNLSELLNFENLQIGGNFRSFALNSNGQVYTDFDDVLRYRQFGLYTQLQRKFADEKLKLTGTLRYDKSKNFKGKFTPRATISYAAGDKKNHNFRIGFQTGFRNPTSQDQYSGLIAGNSILLGSVDDNLNRYTTEVELVSSNTIEGIATSTLTGNNAFDNSFTSASVEAFQNDFRSKVANAGTTVGVIPDVSLLVASDFEKVKPETMRSYELGYRGAVNISGSLFEFDVVTYYSVLTDFITETEVVVPLYGDVENIVLESDASELSFTDATATLSGLNAINAISRQDFQRFQISTNANSNLVSYGASLGFNTKIFEKFDLSASYAFANFSIEESKDDDNLDFSPAFNTPKHSVKLQFGSEKLVKNFGFAINTRWQDKFLYQTRFLDREVSARFILDAQVNYTIPSMKSVIKIGATNLLGNDYYSIPESGKIGSQGYISWTYNN